MCVDWMNVKSQIQELENAKLDYLHIDVVDGNFAPDFTMGSSIINTVKENTALPFDYHIMAEEPSRLFNSFNVNRSDFFTIHQETSRNLHRDIVRIKKEISKVGVALSPGTPIESLEYILEDVDLVVLMTVNPGYKGQPLVPQVLKKVKKLRKIIDDYNYQTKISVDGNVSFENIPEMVASGADLLVLGTSGLFRKDYTIPECMNMIHVAIDQGLSR
jgi:ribulose-phosphate 3-epimerase